MLEMSDLTFKNYYDILDSNQIKLIMRFGSFGKKSLTNLIHGYEDAVQVNIDLPTQII